jgi:hypothetical protein
LAGAEQLMSGYVQYSSPGQTQQSTILSTSETSAKTYAKNYASYNTAGGVSSLSLKVADIEFGFTDASNTCTAAPGYSGFPNTIKVTMRLDRSANGSLKLFFAPVLGMSSTDLLPTKGVTATVDTEWIGAPGFKASDLNERSVGTSFLLPLFEPVVSTPGPSYQATSDSTGPAAGTSAGHGNNTYYDIVGFVGVQISQVDKSSDAYIQPSAMISPTFVYDLTTVAPAGTTSSLMTTFTTPKLTQ